jgi:opacity protein-like surface antigen
MIMTLQLFRPAVCRITMSMVLLLAAAWGTPSRAHDENVYFTAQAGTSSATMTGITNVGGSFEPGTTATDLSLKDSTLAGAKMGLYSRMGLFGVEAEVFRTRPNAGVQTQTFNEPSFGPFQQTRGASQTVTAYAVNLLVRQPLAERVVGHIGIGPAWYRSDLQFDREQEQTSKKLGLNTQLGVTYFFSRHVMLSAEWKYNAVKFDFPTHGTTEGFKTDYKANHFALGLTYAFDWAWPWVGPDMRSRLGLPSSHIGPRE